MCVSWLQATALSSSSFHLFKNTLSLGVTQSRTWLPSPSAVRLGSAFETPFPTERSAELGTAGARGAAGGGDGGGRASTGDAAAAPVYQTPPLSHVRSTSTSFSLSLILVPALRKKRKYFPSSEGSERGARSHAGCTELRRQDQASLPREPSSPLVLLTARKVWASAFCSSSRGDTVGSGICLEGHDFSVKFSKLWWQFSDASYELYRIKEAPTGFL